MADIIGGDEIREMIEAFLSESLLTNTRKISVTYLNTLGKLSLDYPRKSVLYDVTLRIGPLKVARKYDLSFALKNFLLFFKDICHVCNIWISSRYFSVSNHRTSLIGRSYIWRIGVNLCRSARLYCGSSTWSGIICIQGAFIYSYVYYSSIIYYSK